LVDSTFTLKGSFCEHYPLDQGKSQLINKLRT